MFYNHARTLDGTPAGELSLPVAVPIDIRTDDRGGWNAARYLDNPLADAVLSGIKAGAIRGMSYSGRYVKSTRSWPDGRGRGALPLIVRHEIALREMGPTAIPAYAGAEILGHRAELFLRALLAADPSERLRLIQQYEGLEPLLRESDGPRGTPVGAAAQADEPAHHSARPMPLRTRIRAARIARGMECTRDTSDPGRPAGDAAHRPPA